MRNQQIFTLGYFVAAQDRIAKALAHQPENIKFKIIQAAVYRKLKNHPQALTLLKELQGSSEYRNDQTSPGTSKPGDFQHQFILKETFNMLSAGGARRQRGR